MQLGVISLSSSRRRYALSWHLLLIQHVHAGALQRWISRLASILQRQEPSSRPANSSFDGLLPHQASLDQIDDSSGRSHPTSTSSSPRRCVHVNFIDRTDGTVHGEDEFLFSPYSGYTVRCIRWCDDPMVDAYTRRFHIIEVIVVHVVSAHLHTCGFQCKQVLVHFVHPHAMLSM